MPDRAFSDMISKVIKLKLQYFKHVNVQVTCPRDPEMYAACHDHKIYLHTKFGIPTSNLYRYALGLTVLELKPEVKDTVSWKQLVTCQGPRCIYIPNMELLPSINNIGDLL